MRLFCLHRWSLWSDCYPEAGVWLQFRYCLKCRKAEHKKV